MNRWRHNFLLCAGNVALHRILLRGTHLGLGSDTALCDTVVLVAEVPVQ